MIFFKRDTPHHNFYPRSPCGERLNSSYGALDGASISIHALLAESDPLNSPTRCCTPNFYPRSPCGERRPLIFNVQPRKTISIHALLAESDFFLFMVYFMFVYFYPRSPCGERPMRPARPMSEGLFLSTLSLRRATTPARISSRLLLISIHALLAESDSVSSVINNVIDDFYPRSPCGERPTDTRQRFIEL